ncbi:hypothetical protein IFR05_013662, partial [Cadophora sp. M221]
MWNRILDTRSGIERCRECRTEYTIDYTYFEGHGMAMFFTRWKDLGPGPESDIWKQHLRGDMLDDLWKGFMQHEVQARGETVIEAQAEIERQPQAGKIASVFGDRDGFEFYSW